MWWTYLSPVGVNVSSWGPVLLLRRRTSRGEQTPPWAPETTRCKSPHFKPPALGINGWHYSSWTAALVWNHGGTIFNFSFFTDTHEPPHDAPLSAGGLCGRRAHTCGDVQATCVTRCYKLKFNPATIWPRTQIRLKVKIGLLQDFLRKNSILIILINDFILLSWGADLNPILSICAPHNTPNNTESLSENKNNILNIKFDIILACEAVINSILNKWKQPPVLSH